MPIERHRYPQNWESLSLKMKEQANWTCQQCGKVCRRYGESVPDYLKRCFIPGSPAWQEAQTHPQKFCLTVAHLDQNPGNNVSDNLLPLCCPCHLNYDRSFQAGNIHAGKERRGQLALELVQ